MQPFELIINGIKCDADGCDYSSPDVPASEFGSYLNRPCPKCGSPLLTDQDLAAIKMLMATVDYGNSMVGCVPDGTEMVNIPIKMDGSGSIDFEQ